MPSPFVHDHARAIARALAELLLGRGSPCGVDAPELARFAGSPITYVRMMGRRYAADIDAIAARSGFNVVVEGDRWTCVTARAAAPWRRVGSAGAISTTAR